MLRWLSALISLDLSPDPFPIGKGRFPTLFAPILATLGLVAIACSSSTSGDRGATATANATTGVYLALGDSFAAGKGASSADLTSYVALVRGGYEEHIRHSVQLTSLAVPGNNTQDLIDKQLPAALDVARTGDVRLITLTIGGNDLNIIQSDPNVGACIIDVNDPKCPVANILVGTEQRLDQILSALHAAAPKATIVIEDYPDLFSGSGHPFEMPAKVAFGLLDGVIDRVAKRNDVLIADPRAAFVGRSLELTHIHDTPPDFHPNDAGHRLIADAFLKALGGPSN